MKIEFDDMPGDKGIVLCTIPHTGTYFFKELLEEHGYSVQVMHCTHSGIAKAKELVAEGHLLITTWRDPIELLNSWNVRHRDKAQWAEHFECWYELHQFEPVIVSIDTDKKERLEFLSQVLGKKLKTKWEVVNEDAPTN